MATSLRWAFPFGSWHPTKDQWILAMQSIQLEEKNRIEKFVFKKDAKASLTGRLMIRKAIHENLNIPWKDIALGRTDKGKPFLRHTGAMLNEFYFNVSHQGDFAVLSAEKHFQVGVDVMKIEKTARHKSTEEYFALMERQFTEQEWTHIRQAGDERQQLAAFYRFWCLKESYVKALGIGLNIPLRSIDFHIHSPLSQDSVINDTQVYVNGNLERDWRFEETLLDANHCATTALQKQTQDWPTRPCPAFSVLQIDELLSLATTISPADEQSWANFNNKKEPQGTTTTTDCQPS